jgi:hypothetical protein
VAPETCLTGGTCAEASARETNRFCLMKRRLSRTGIWKYGGVKLSPEVTRVREEADWVLWGDQIAVGVEQEHSCERTRNGKKASSARSDKILQRRATAGV